MKKLILFQSLIFIIVISTVGCKKDNSIDSDAKNIDSDYELIEDETEGSLVGAGEVAINIDRISGDFPRAIFVNRCNDIWKKITRTKYVHKDNSVIDEQNGIYKFDCSGFACEIVLKPVLTSHYQDLYNRRSPIVDTTGLNYVNVLRPLAGTFYDYFVSEILMDNNIEAENNYWKVFKSVDLLKRGDLIIVRYSDEWRVNEKNSTTGHVMIAWEIGTVNSNNEITIQVMDATSSAHTSSADTRTCNSKPVAEELDNKKSGIGYGKMIYKISSDGYRRPYAYKWSSNSTYWYNLVSGDDISEPDKARYDRLQGIIFARPK